MLNHSVYADGISNLDILCNVFDFESDGTTSIPSDSRAIYLQDSIGTISIGNTTIGGNLIGSRLDKRSIEIVQATTPSSPIIYIENNYIGVEKSGQNAPENLSGLSHIYISGDDINSSFPIVNLGGANTLQQGNCSGSCNIVACSTGTTPAISLLKTGVSNIQGNHLGIKKDGSSGLTYLGSTACILTSLGSTGVLIDEPKGDVTVGGDLTSQRNHISGFGYSGLIYDDPDASVNLDINNNYFGSDSDASSVVSNSKSNILFYDGLATIQNNTISGVSSVINDSAGIIISTENVDSSIEIFGNYIGTNSTLQTNLGNRDAGITVDGGSVGSINIGKLNENPNYIKFNKYHGVLNNQSYSPVNVINNVIEENVAYGIYFYRAGGSPEDSRINNNLIKNTKGEGNSDGYGFAAYASNNMSILENLFCNDDTDAANFDYPAAAFFENDNNGVIMDGNTLQSTYASGFVVPWNDVGISIINSNFHTKPQPGVDLGDDEPSGDARGNTPNDAGDIDIGPNNYQNYPEITSVDDETINYRLDTNEGEYHVEFHIPNDEPICGQGNSLICTTTITHVGNGFQNFSLNCPALPDRPYNLTSIATKKIGLNQYGDTSELSPISVISTVQSTITPTLQPTPRLGTTTVVPTNTITTLSNPLSTTVSPTIQPSVTIITPTSVTPTEKSISLIDDSPPGGLYTIPEDSLLKHPIIKSKLLDIFKFIDNEINSATITGSLLLAGTEISEFTQPITDSLLYLMSLQFIGKESSVSAVNALNIFTFATPVIITIISKPNIFNIAFFWIWKKKKSPTWGVVLDKVSKSPVAFARLILTQDGKTINTYTTDLMGRYGLDAKRGLYKIFILHSEYLEESKIVEVKKDGQLFTLDFEITPKVQEDFHRNISWRAYNVKIFISKNLFIVNTIIFSTGFVYTLFAVTNSFSALNYVILMCYIIQILVAIVLNFIKEKDLGQVLDINTSKPIKGAVVRLFDNQKQLDVTITDSQGLYSFIVDPGVYYLNVNASGYIFPTHDNPNIEVNQVGEKLLKFTAQDPQKIALRLYVKKFASGSSKNTSILSPFS